MLYLETVTCIVTANPSPKNVSQACRCSCLKPWNPRHFRHPLLEKKQKTLSRSRVPQNPNGSNGLSSYVPYENLAVFHGCSWKSGNFSGLSPIFRQEGWSCCFMLLLHISPLDPRSITSQCIQACVTKEPGLQHFWEDKVRLVQSGLVRLNDEPKEGSVQRRSERRAQWWRLFGALKWGIGDDFSWWFIIDDWWLMMINDDVWLLYYWVMNDQLFHGVIAWDMIFERNEPGMWMVSMTFRGFRMIF